MKLTLINPPWLFLDKPNYLPQNLGLRYLTSYLKSKGHEVNFLDALQLGFNISQKISINGKTYNLFGLSNFDIIEMIPKDTDYIGIGIPFTFLESIVKSLIFDIKKSLRIPIITGGVFPSTNPKAAEEISDYFIIGEGELPLEQLMSGSKIETIKGLNSSTFSNGQSNFIKNIDLLPLPYRNDFRKFLRMSSRGRKGMRTATLITSRGCPFNCNFCSTHPTSGYKWRARTPENIITEIIYLVKKFNVNHIEIEDDNFSLNQERTKSILESIIKFNTQNNYNVSFSTPNGLRIDTLNEKIISLLKKANFTSINLALESGDEYILKKMNKNISLSKVINVAIAAEKYNLPILYFFMIGYPGEMRENFYISVNFAKKLKEIGNGNASFTTFITRAYPGTSLFNMCLSKGYIQKESENEVFLGSKYNISTPEFNEDELKFRLKYANKILNDGEKQNYIL